MADTHGHTPGPLSSRGTDVPSASPSRGADVSSASRSANIPSAATPDAPTTSPQDTSPALSSLDPAVAELVEHPYNFDFFRAIRLLESLRPDLPRVGFSLSPSEDPVRFCQNPSLGFAPAAIESVQAGDNALPPRMAVRFFGLFGPNAPLPPHLTEYAIERQMPPHRDPTIAAFLNLFHHRLLSFFYRAWAANQKAADLDRPADQRYGTFIGSFFGIGMKSLQEQDSVPDNAKLFFAGRLACQTRNAEGLEAILREYFHIPAQVQPFAGRWLRLPEDSKCQLGCSPDSGSLGVNTLVGERFWDCQLSIRVRFGPMGFKDYERMLPKGDSFERLKYWIMNYCGQHFFWDVQLVLRADEVPETRLGTSGRLGWTSWLKTKPFTRDADELILNPPPDDDC